MIVRYTDEEYKNAKSTDKLALECEHCGKIFYGEKKQITFELKNNRGRLKFCSVECSDLAHRKSHQLHCEECGKDVEVTASAYKASKTKHFFCSKSCAAKYNNRLREKPSEETKRKTSESILKYYHSKFGESYKPKKKNITNTIVPRKEYICRICGRKYHLNESGVTRMFCSRECLNEYRTNRKKYLSEDAIKKLSTAGKHSAKVQGENRRSKNEKYFCELCEKHFNNVKHNEPIFNGWDADVIIEDIKVAVLWNGKWHYQKIKEDHSVEQVQNRDKIKIKEIKNCGYTPYIIKDMGKYKKQFVEDEFNKLIKYIASEWNV
jgi:YHS domain-containing protein